MPETYIPIQTHVVSVVNSSFTFSNIPQNYTDLRLVVNARTTSGDTNILALRFNGSTFEYYARTYMQGNGTTTLSVTNTGLTSAYGLYVKQVPTLLEFDIMNYSNTTTYKTTLLRGTDSSTNTLASALLWRGSNGSSTEAISSITIFLLTGTYVVGSTFSLYGIKAA